MLSVGSLFSGIGGFDLGLERAGMRVVWQCETEPFCRAALAKHWPGVLCYADIRDLRGADVRPIDVLCGGFPCQDISTIGPGTGISGSRSGLWGEFARLIGELRPRYVIVENSAALRTRGLGRVLGDLAARGYDAEWDCVQARAVGAPHSRDRIWIVAYPARDAEAGAASSAGAVGKRAGAGGEQGGAPGRSSWWAVEPSVGRVADGVPDRVDALASLGNALVPQIPEWIGQRIIEYEGRRAA